MSEASTSETSSTSNSSSDSGDSLYDAIVQHILGHYSSSHKFSIPKCVPIGTLVMMYGDMKEIVTDEILEEFVNAIDAHVHGIKETIDIQKLAEDSNKSIEFVNKWFDESKWKDSINPNLESNENIEFVVDVDLMIV